MIKVLIVEDSMTVGTFLEYIFNQEEDMEVIGRVGNGKDAVNFVRRNKPDVITMDIEMPVMNGLEATREIMSFLPVPIVIVTASRNARETKLTMEALEAGAVTLIEKPSSITTSKGVSSAKELVTTTRLMSEVKVVTRRIKKTKKEKPLVSAKATVQTKNERVNLIAIGVSTGGPATLKELLSPLDKSFPYPIVIVQHIANGFIKGMVDWLKNTLSIDVKLAEYGETPRKGVVYFAPDGNHLTLTRSGRFQLEFAENDNICPSVARLFKSILPVYGNHSAVIMLTGMGKDGAKEMKALHDAGALTIAQSKESALIYGMPQEVVKLGGARYVLSTSEISGFLMKLAAEKKR